MTIIELTDGFDSIIKLIMEDMADDFRLVNYNSKEEIEKEFLPYAKPVVATPYIEQYFEEEDGVIYGLPQDGPAWFEKEAEYTLEDQSETKILLTQTNENELHGAYTINIQFENNNVQCGVCQYSCRI